MPVWPSVVQKRSRLVELKVTLPAAAVRPRKSAVKRFGAGRSKRQ